MLKIDPGNNNFTALGRTRWWSVSFFERHSLTDFIAGGVADVFQEAGLELMILAANVPLDGGSERSADLLALDPAGRVCLVFTARRQTSEEVGLALEDISRAARWNWHDAVQSLKNSCGDELGAFLEAPSERVNFEQRAILVGEEFDEEALATANFLANRCGVLISCLKLGLRVDKAGREYLSVDDALAGEDSEEAWFVDKKERDPAASELGAVVAAPSLEPVSDALASTDEDSVGEPLSELLEDTARSALAGTASPVEESDERRTGRRLGSCHARRLRFDYFGRPMGARLIDFSDGGLGAETLAPLPVGATVAISAELSTDTGLISLDGGARVKHCRPRSNGVCRVGLSFPHSAIREIVEAEAFDRR